MEDIEKSSKDDRQWYVMRVTYQREVSAKMKLDELSVENFLPMRTERRRRPNGRFCKSLIPLIHNYLFVRSNREVLDGIKAFSLPYLRYATCVRDGRREIMIVPESQMRSFIAVVERGDSKAVFLDPASIDLNEGDKVRIIEGPFAGVEGTFMRLQDGRGKRVIVKIESVAAVATTEISPRFVEKIQQ